jgi:hypothetical protein
MGNCVSIDVKYPDVESNDNVGFESPSNAWVFKEVSNFERRCDELATEILGLLPKAHVVRI